MKAIKSLLAVSVLAAAGVANAATVATFTTNFTPVSSAYKPMGGMDIVDHSSPYNGGVGTATLDDSGVLTLNTSNRMLTIFGTDTITTLTVTVNGTWDGTTFTALSGSENMLSCVDGDQGFTPACGSTVLGVSPYLSVGGSITLAGGTLTTVLDSANATSTYSYAFGPGTPAVPVPAAAWLFGSGLLGLAGVSRRRRAA